MQTNRNNRRKNNTPWRDDVSKSVLDVEDETVDDTRPCSVYYFHNADHELLYVGISVSAIARFSAHAREKDWWTEVAYASIEHMPTVVHARHREAAAIKKLEPKYNQARPDYGPCKNCDQPKQNSRNGMCTNCYEYDRKYGKPRPARLYNKVRLGQ